MVVDADGGSHSLDLGGYVSEPLVVPGGRAGWVLVPVYDPARDATAIAILDAADPTPGPIARAWFPHHIPFTFHGTWVSEPGSGL